MQWAVLGRALLAQGAAMVAAHGVIVLLSRRHGAWDTRQDLVTGLVVAGMIAATVRVNVDALRGVISP